MLCLHSNKIKINIKMNSLEDSANLWFHGLIDRRLAEQRLIANNKPNSYLVRESRASQQSGGQKSFVVSFLGQLSGINHFRVHSICGHFYIGSKAFQSFQHLINFYTNSSDLLRGERLQSPVPPPEPHSNDVYGSARRLVAVLPYNKMPESDELSFKKGDLFTVHNDLQNGWLWVTSSRTLESGLVFQELLEPLNDENESLPYFHPRISKEEAVDLLARSGPGSFLVRHSDNSPGNYSLFFHIENSVQRFRIERTNNRYVMGGRVFSSLQEVISRYKNEQIVEGFRLLKPVFKSLSFDDNHDSQRQQPTTDVYQTIRESREAQKKNSDILLQGFLHKKSEKHKKWKNYYFVLNSKDSHLYYYENERRTRPKAVVDLSYSYVYSNHDSLFERSHCFQVVERALPCLSTVYYLSASDADVCRQWIQSLLSLCRPQLSSNTIQEGDYRLVRCLFLTLLEGMGFPVKFCSNPYIEVQFNGGVKVGRSQVKCPPDPIWEEDFVFEDIPLDVTSFSLVLYNKGKRKDTEIAETTIELSRMRENEEREETFHLSGICPPIRDSWGAVRARTRFQSELILAFEEYQSLKDLLTDLDVLNVCEQFCCSDRQPLAQAVLKIARFSSKELLLIRSLIEREIQNETQVGTLFRANSMTTALIDFYLRGICQQFIVRALREPILKILESKTSCEVNPSRLDSPQEACHNAEHLLDVLDLFSENIFKSVSEVPKQLAFICACLQRAVSQKWTNDSLVRTRVVSGFVFLRLICPAILNPKQFSLINEIPSETCARTLILIAKSLQNLSNLIEFGTKSIFISEDRFEPPPPPNSKREPWMEIVNPFILKNKSKMIKFLDDISACADPHQPPPAQWPASQQWEEPTRELALIHSICDLHKQEIQEMSTNKPSLRKLFLVIEFLSKRKNRFLK